VLGGVDHVAFVVLLGVCGAMSLSIIFTLSVRARGLSGNPWHRLFSRSSGKRFVDSLVAGRLVCVLSRHELSAQSGARRRAEARSGGS